MINIALTNLGKYNEGLLIYEWLELPATDEEISEAMKKIGINEEYEEFFITDYESEIPGLKVHEYENIEKLNEMAEELESLEEYELEKIAAIIDYTDYELAAIIENVDDYQFYPGVSSDEELGYEYAEMLNVPEELENYIDWETYGRECRLSEGGAFVTGGYVFSY